MGLLSKTLKPLAQLDAPPSSRGNPLGVALTEPHLSPFGGPPAPSGPVEVVVDDTHHSVRESTYDDAAPSRQDLLKRAAELGPPRMTWASIALSPSDPILADKMQPHVAERRARFRKLVKVTLGACAAFCLVATVATALSGSSTPSSASASFTKTAPAAGVVPIEKLEQATRTKAASHVTAARPTKWAKRR